MQCSKLFHPFPWSLFTSPAPRIRNMALICVSGPGTRRSHPVAPHRHGRTHFVAQGVGVLCHHCPAAVRHGPGPGARVTLLWGGADADAVRPFQPVVEFLHVVLVDAAAALPDAVIAVDAEVEVFATRWEIPCFSTVFLLKVFEGFIYIILLSPSWGFLRLQRFLSLYDSLKIVKKNSYTVETLCPDK